MVKKIIEKIMQKGKKGQGMVEYALIIALVAILLVGGIAAMREQIEGVFTSITSALTGGT